MGWAEVTSHAAMPHTQNVYRPGRVMQDEFGARNRPLTGSAARPPELATIG